MGTNYLFRPYICAMPTVSIYPRNKKSKNPTNLTFRLRAGKNVDVIYTSSIEVIPLYWDERLQELRKTTHYPLEQRYEISRQVAQIKILILDAYFQERNNSSLTTDSLKTHIESILYPSQKQPIPVISSPKRSFFGAFDEFLQRSNISKGRNDAYRVLLNILKRFELYKSKSDNNFKLNFQTVNLSVIEEFERYLYEEYELLKTPEFSKIKTIGYRSHKQRGGNTIVGMMKKLRAFYNWAIRNEYTSKNPFLKYKSLAPIYGTPVFPTVEEVTRIYNHNFSFNPKLEVQRDIFVFQCMIGARCGDLYSLTKQHIIDGCVTFIPQKTKKERAVTVSIPLNTKALAIVDKYRFYAGDSLFPFISHQKYNYAIKDIFTLANIIRSVVVLNPLTRQQEIRPINQIASSHMARKFFIGNMYNKVQDPSLIGSLSGHVAGSKAFARYRSINKELQQKLVDFLE